MFVPPEPDPTLSLTIDKIDHTKLNYDDILGDPVTFVLTADSISPGDGSATLSASIIMEVPLD